MPHIFSCYPFWFLQKPLLSILSLLLLLSSNLYAKSNSLFSTDCDTLIKKSGKEMLVVIQRTTLDKVYYSDCGDTSGQVKQMRRSTLLRIRLSKESQSLLSSPPEGASQIVEQLYEQPNLAAIGLGLCVSGLGLLLFAATVASPFGLFITGIFFLLGGTIMSLFFLRGTRKSKSTYKKKRHVAWVSALLGLIPSVLFLLFEMIERLLDFLGIV